MPISLKRSFLQAPVPWWRWLVHRLDFIILILYQWVSGLFTSCKQFSQAFKQINTKIWSLNLKWTVRVFKRGFMHSVPENQIQALTKRCPVYLAAGACPAQCSSTARTSCCLGRIGVHALAAIAQRYRYLELAVRSVSIGSMRAACKWYSKIRRHWWRGPADRASPPHPRGSVYGFHYGDLGQSHLRDHATFRCDSVAWVCAFGTFRRSHNWVGRWSCWSYFIEINYSIVQPINTKAFYKKNFSQGLALRINSEGVRPGQSRRCYGGSESKLVALIYGEPPPSQVRWILPLRGNHLVELGVVGSISTKLHGFWKGIF